MADAGRRLALIVDLIDRTQRDLIGPDEAAYGSDPVLIDATAFRVMHVGENASRLDASIKARHDHLPWSDMVAMRNILAHDYARMNTLLVRRTAVEHFDQLRTACIAELATMKNEGE